MEFFALMLLFISPLFNTTLYVMGIELQSGQLGIIYTALSIVCYVFFIVLVFKRRYSIKIYMLLCLVLLFITSFYTTSLIYGYINEIYWSQFLSFGSMTVSSILIGIILSKKRKPELFGLSIPFFIILITVSSFLAVITNNETTTGGYMNDSSGFSYQNTAYYAAYAFGLNVYFLHFKNKLVLLSWFKKSVWDTIFKAMLIIQVITCLLAGGRGGFILLLCFVFYALLLNISSIKNIKQISNNLINVTIISLIGITMFNYLSPNITYSGFDRIATLITGTIDTTRISLQNMAIDSFSKSPILGNGIGSVFYEIGTYSHNLFTDILVEAGLIGIIIILFTIIIFTKRILYMIKINPLYHFILVILICGVVLNMFSGYWLASQQIWFSLSYVLSINIQILKEKKEISNFERY